MLDRDYLYKRLKDTKNARREVEDRNPTVQFCLSCDEIYVDEISDCAMEHRVVTEGWDQEEVSAWIDCIDYLRQSREKNL